MWILDNLTPTSSDLWMDLMNVNIAFEKLWYPNYLLYRGDKNQVDHAREMVIKYLETRDARFKR